MSAIQLPDPRPARDRQLAIAILAAAALAVVAIIALPMWVAHRHYDVALAEATNRLDRFGRIFATRPSVVKQLEAMRGKETKRFFLRSGGASLSAAEAQQTVQGLIEASGGRFITMQPPVAKEEGRYRLITANVQLQANIFALRKLLAAIDSNVPFLFVDNLTVRSTVPGNFRPQPGAEPEMFVQFDISGYALTGTP